MGVNGEAIWIFKVNPKLMDFLDRLLRVMEQQSMIALKEEKSFDEKRHPGDLVTVEEAARRIGVSKHTLRGWVSQRRIPFVKIGRRTLFSHSGLDEFIRSCTVEPRKARSKF
jgi:excisionase family DNA binding protein